MNRTLRTLAVAALAFSAAGLSVGRPVLAADVAAKPADAAKPAGKPIKALFICSGGFHDYAKQKKIITDGISARANVEWTIFQDVDKSTTNVPSIYAKDDWYEGFDVIVHDECSADVKDLKIVNRVLKPHKAGVPAVFLHCAMHSFRSEGWPKEVTPWFQLTGLRTTAHGAQLPIEVTYVDAESPITKDLKPWTTVKEELYNNISGKLEDTAKPLAHGKQVSKGKDGKEKVDETIVAWTNLYEGKAKVFGTTLGHNNDTTADARYLNLITRGLLWSVGKLDDEHFKSSDKDVDVKAISAVFPADAKGEKAVSAVVVKDGHCCGE